MSESSRRIHTASRDATTALNGYTEEDVAWTEVRVIALMIEGVVFVEAVCQAARECSQRIGERKLQELDELAAMRERQREEARAERAAQRNAIEVRANLGQKPSLKASFGDLLAAKRGGK